MGLAIFQNLKGRGPRPVCVPSSRRISTSRHVGWGSRSRFSLGRLWRERQWNQLPVSFQTEAQGPVWALLAVGFLPWCGEGPAGTPHSLPAPRLDDGRSDRPLKGQARGLSFITSPPAGGCDQTEIGPEEGATPRKRSQSPPSASTGSFREAAVGFGQDPKSIQ